MAEGGERKTLLKIEGDASGVKRAAEDAKKAIQGVTDVAEGSAGKLDAATKIDPTTIGQTKDQAGAVSELASALGESDQKANAFREALSRVSPQLAGMLDVGTGAAAIFKTMFNPIIAGAAAAIAAIFAVAHAIGAATKAAREFADQQQRVKLGGIAVETAVSQELAKAGKGSEAAFTSATAVAKRLEERGFEPAAARSAAAALVSDEGGLLVPEADLELFVAGVQRGDIELGGQTARKRGASLRRASRLVGRRRPELTAAVQAIRRPRGRETSRGQRGSVSDVAAILERTEGLSSEHAQQVARDMLELENRGLGSIGMPVTRDLDELKDRVLGGIGTSGVLSGFEDEGLFKNAFTDVGIFIPAAILQTDREKRILDAQRFQKVLQPRLRGNATEVPAESGSAAPTAIINNHGVINFAGSRNRAPRPQRMELP